MLNLRCLAIVFDLDETLMVANTMKSFEDKIEALLRRIDVENDPARVSGMSAELKRYIDDKILLKQYIGTDTVSKNGTLLSAQSEEVPPIFGIQEKIVRPVIRLLERNIVLTRIHPEIRVTSVFVRLRPAWEDLRSYLTAKSSRRFRFGMTKINLACMLSLHSLHIMLLKQRWPMLFLYYVLQGMLHAMSEVVFSKFDENLLQKIYELNYEIERVDLPDAPDVSGYLVSEVNNIQNNNREASIAEGMTGSEIEHRLNQLVYFADKGQIKPQMQSNYPSTD